MKSSNKSSNPMTQKAASQIQSTTAKSNDGKVPAGSFASRAARAVSRTGQQSGKQK